MKGRVAWLLVGVLVTLIAIPSTAFALWYRLGAKNSFQHQWTQTVRYTGRPAELNVQLVDGAIHITAGRAGQITVTRQARWTHDRPQISEAWQGSTFAINDDCPSGLLDSVCAVDYWIALPPGTALNLLTDNGDISVRDDTARVVVATSSYGDISLAFAAPPQMVRAIANDGNATVLLPRGDAYAVDPSAGGNTFVSVVTSLSAPRFISASADNGNVTIRYR